MSMNGTEVEALARTLVQALQKALELVQTDEATIITRAALALLKSQELADVVAHLSSALLQLLAVLQNQETAHLRAQLELLAAKVCAHFLVHLERGTAQQQQQQGGANASSAPSSSASSFSAALAGMSLADPLPALSAPPSAALAQTHAQAQVQVGAALERWQPVLRLVGAMEESGQLASDDAVKLRRLCRRQSFELLVLFETYRDDAPRFARYVRELLEDL